MRDKLRMCGFRSQSAPTNSQEIEKWPTNGPYIYSRTKKKRWPSGESGLTEDSCMERPKFRIPNQYTREKYHILFAEAGEDNLKKRALSIS